MNAGDFGVVSTTLAELGDAERIAALLLEEKLAACVQIFRIDSNYVWKGETNHQPELMLLIKTRATLIREVQATIASLHSYDVPEFLVLSVSGGSEAYLAWLEASLR